MREELSEIKNKRRNYNRKVGCTEQIKFEFQHKEKTQIEIKDKEAIGKIL